MRAIGLACDATGASPIISLAHVTPGRKKDPFYINTRNPIPQKIQRIPNIDPAQARRPEIRRNAQMGPMPAAAAGTSSTNATSWIPLPRKGGVDRFRVYPSLESSRPST